MIKTVRSIAMSHAFIRYRKRKPSDLEAFYRLYGVPGEVYLKLMGTFDFAPGAVDEMMARIEEAFEAENNY